MYIHIMNNVCYFVLCLMTIQILDFKSIKSLTFHSIHIFKNTFVHSFDINLMFKLFAPRKIKLNTNSFYIHHLVPVLIFLVNEQ